MIQKLIDWAKWALLWHIKICAKLQLLKSKPYIIGVTGSVGKTSAIYAIEAVLKDHETLRVTHQVNSETGIPLHILGVKLKDYSLSSWAQAFYMAPLKLLTNWQKFQTYLIEMGIDGPHPPKNMSYLLSIVSPNVGVFLNAQAVHSEYFDPLVEGMENRKEKIIEKIASEKGKLIESLPENGYAILNLDDPNVAACIGKTKAQVITFGFSNDATITIRSVVASKQGTWVSIQHEDQVFDFIIPKLALSRVYGYTFAAALAVGLSKGMPLEKSVENIKRNFTIPAGRMSLLEGINNSLIIDSSYNASIEPMLESLDTLNVIGEGGRKIALLGDMRELGSMTEQAHIVVAKKALEVADQVFLVGPQMKEYALPILEGKATWYKNAKDAVLVIQKSISQSDVILIKGSQNTIFLEYAVEKLLRKPETASNLLCRRGAYWDKRRREAGLD